MPPPLVSSALSLPPPPTAANRRCHHRRCLHCCSRRRLHCRRGLAWAVGVRRRLSHSRRHRGCRSRLKERCMCGTGNRSAAGTTRKCDAGADTTAGRYHCLRTPCHHPLVSMRVGATAFALLHHFAKGLCGHTPLVRIRCDDFACAHAGRCHCARTLVTAPPASMRADAMASVLSALTEPASIRGTAAS